MNKRKRTCFVILPLKLLTTKYPQTQPLFEYSQLYSENLVSKSHLETQARCSYCHRKRFHTLLLLYLNCMKPLVHSSLPKTKQLPMQRLFTCPEKPLFHADPPWSDTTSGTLSPSRSHQQHTLPNSLHAALGRVKQRRPPDGAWARVRIAGPGTPFSGSGGTTLRSKWWPSCRRAFSPRHPARLSVSISAAGGKGRPGPSGATLPFWEKRL